MVVVSLDVVVPILADQDVVPFEAADEVRAPTTPQLVDAIGAVQHVVARAADQEVSPVASGQGVVTGAAEQRLRLVARGWLIGAEALPAGRALRATSSVLTAGGAPSLAAKYTAARIAAAATSARIGKLNLLDIVLSRAWMMLLAIPHASLTNPARRANQLPGSVSWSSLYC